MASHRQIDGAIGGVTPPIAFRAARRPLVALVVAAIAVAMACERRDVGRPSVDPGPVVARINGQPLYRADLDAYLPADEFALSTLEERRNLIAGRPALYEEAACTDGCLDEIDRKLEQQEGPVVTASCRKAERASHRHCAPK
jgi:hypothetical protein